MNLHEAVQKRFRSGESDGGFIVLYQVPQSVNGGAGRIRQPTFGPRLLVTAMTRQGTLFLWPIRLPGPDGKIDTWNESALSAAERAKDHWVRVVANMDLQGYDVFEATGDIPPPIWPELGLEEILEIAFRNRYIESLDHPALRRLRGEI